MMMRVGAPKLLSSDGMRCRIVYGIRPGDDYLVVTVIESHKLHPYSLRVVLHVIMIQVRGVQMEGCMFFSAFRKKHQIRCWGCICGG
jgi:hypothetical protein